MPEWARKIMIEQLAELAGAPTRPPGDIDTARERLSNIDAHLARMGLDARTLEEVLPAVVECARRSRKWFRARAELAAEVDRVAREAWFPNPHAATDDDWRKRALSRGHLEPIIQRLRDPGQPKAEHAASVEAEFVARVKATYLGLHS